MNLAEKTRTAAPAATYHDVAIDRFEALMVQSARCRRLADSISDSSVSATLRSMAREYEADAAYCRG